MISKVRQKRDPYNWHPYFCWRPRKVHNGATKLYVWVWWEWVERKGAWFGGGEGNMVWTLRMKRPCA